jgi:hypothetical protein
MNLLQECPNQSVFRHPVAETVSRWKVTLLHLATRFLSALVRGMAVGAA